MQLKRVVVTGIGAVSGLGPDVASLIDGIEQGKSAVCHMDQWEDYIGLRSLVGAPSKLENEKAIPRQKRRSMSRIGIFAVQASQQALDDSGMDPDLLSSGGTGCVIGSTMGGTEALNEAFEAIIPDKDISQLGSMKFFQCISHTAVMNVAQYFGINGCVMAPCAACASGLQAVGAAYDLVRLGKQDIVLCGGAEELHPIVTASFDVLYAASTGFNDRPKATPRPFDAERDGVVCGDGCGMLVLEEYEHAIKRNAKIYGEVTGYHTCGNGNHISQSNRNAMIACMQGAMADAEVTPEEIDYVNAHATATVQGDVEEACAIKQVLGSSPPVSSLKGYLGHALGASGSLELIASLIMMQKGVIYPTLNLETPAEECKGINHVTRPLKQNIDTFVKNCFGFGGINAALVCKKYKT
jgi:3-oxoacyl-[acyl-carrier-protein] synthase II